MDNIKALLKALEEKRLKELQKIFNAEGVTQEERAVIFGRIQELTLITDFIKKKLNNY